jgi:hypothetical protein
MMTIIILILLSLYTHSVNALGAKQFDFDGFYRYNAPHKHCGETPFRKECDMRLQEAIKYIQQNKLVLIDLDTNTAISQDKDSFSCSCTVTIVYN